MSKKKHLRVCVIIPAYNEATIIGSVVDAVDAAFAKTAHTYQICVVNDGSKDNTAAEASIHGAYVISHILNSGAGGATATGLSYAYQNGFDVAVTMDGDGQHAPADVVKGVEEIEKRNVDLLIGSRLIDKRGMSKVKVLGNKGLSMITNFLFGIQVTDSQSGLRVFSKLALSSLKWKTSGYEFCSEMLWRAKQLNLVMDEYPISAIYTDYSKAKGQNNWNAINILTSLLKRRLTELFNE